MFNATSGKLKTVKQLQLGIFTKRKTGSKMMIQCLNRLGHSVSYSEVNKFETSIAERESQHINMQSYLPNNIQPSTFVTFIYDNCDHNPESITGVSMHCTNGIIVQRQSPNRFKIYFATVSKIFQSWIRAMAKYISSIVYMPEEMQIRENLPERFQNKRNVVAIIDCSEIFIETPKNLELQSTTWSEYKHHNTMKFTTQ